jgi:uncharacterized protein (UPF0332 family)
MEKVDALERKSQKYLRSAAVLLELEDFDSCASRAYFAMFFAAQALLLLETQSLSSKQGIRSAFAERFVASGRLPARAAEVFEQAAELQEFGDYAYDFAVKRADAENILAEAEAFVNTIELLIERARVES